MLCNNKQKKIHNNKDTINYNNNRDDDRSGINTNTTTNDKSKQATNVGTRYSLELES